MFTYLHSFQRRKYHRVQDFLADFWGSNWVLKMGPKNGLKFSFCQF